MKPYKFILLLFLICAVLSATFSCQPIATSNKKTIVVTYSILGSIVKQLVGDAATVIVSIPNGLDLHEWEPSAKDIEAINKADLVIQNGLGLEGGLEKTLRLAKENGIKFFTASEHITVRYVRQGEGIPSEDPDQVVGAPDPHLWMDPLTIKNVVSALDQVFKETLDLDVSSQAIKLINTLDDLNKEIKNITSIIPSSNRKLITGHESMGYFAQRYNFKLVGVIIPSLSSQAGVSAADLASLKKAIQENDVKAIFTEIGTSSAVADTIGEETGVAVIQLSTHLLPADGLYSTFMTDIANTITNALK